MLDVRQFNDTTEDLDPTVEEAIAYYCEDCRRRAIADSTLKVYRHVSSHLRAVHLTDLRLSQVSKKMVLAIRDELAKEKGQTSANLTMAFLSAVFNYANRMSETVITNPVSALRRLPVEPKQVSYGRNDLARLKSAFRQAPPAAKPQLYFLLYTGIRFGSMKGIQVGDVDDQRMTMRLRVLKGKPNGAVLPINRQALKWYRVAVQTKEILRPEVPYAFVSPYSRSGEVAGSSYPAVKQYVPDFSPHTLRRTFASALEAVGTPHYTLKSLLCHSVSGDVTGNYVKPDHSVMRDYSQKAADWIDAQTARSQVFLPRPD